MIPSTGVGPIQTITVGPNGVVIPTGREAAVELVRRGAGRAFDPQLTEAFLDLAARDGFWVEFEDEEHLRAHVLALEPVDARRPGGLEALDRFTEVLGDLVDFKRPATAGHARRVADRSRRLGERLGLDGAELGTLRRAALIHDLGLIALSTRELAGRGGAAYRAHPLAPAAWLDGVPTLGPVCDLVALHHERVDGSGWPGRTGAAHQSTAARILAVACALDEASNGAADAEAEVLAALAAAGGLDRVVLGALAADLGAPRVAPPPLPAGLTEREVEVLRLAAAGLSVHEIAHRLVISRHTARHHIESVYAKAGCSTRAAAALFAAEHGLLD